MATAMINAVREDSAPRVSISSLTMATTTRRTTCDLCRERKVRCDRTKPECLRCRRFGSACTYPSPDAARIHETLHNLSKRLEDAESRLGSQQSSMQCATPISASEAQMPDFSAVDLPTLGFLADAGGDPEFQTWCWDQPMTESLLPNSMLFHRFQTPSGTESASRATTATSSEPCSVSKELSREPLSDAMAVEQPSPPENWFSLSPASVESCAGLYEAYFQVVQKHLPLICKETFFQTLKESPEKHQTLALKHAVCMAGAQVGRVPFQSRQQYYIAARHHLEQAELDSGGSSFWTIEAAQALVLVTRFEFENFPNPRASMTMSRLYALMAILGYEIPGSEKTQGVNEAQLSRWKTISLINLSIKFQETCGGESFYSKNLSRPSPPSSLHDEVKSERMKIDLLTSSQPIPEHDPFGLLCISLRIAIEAKHHDQLTSASIAGVDSPSFNFCRDHERIETEIGTVVTKWLTPSASSELSSGPNCELRVLALLSALGTRIQLFKTASYHGRKSKFLSTISSECREEGISSAIDISDLLCLAEVRRLDKVAVYREANFYLLPPLRLAAEVLVTALQARAQESTRRLSHRHLEIRQSLKTIFNVMEDCKNEAGSYSDSIAKMRAYLDSSEETPTPLRSSFSASSSLSKN